jgi:hypothetical protein
MYNIICVCQRVPCVTAPECWMTCVGFAPPENLRPRTVYPDRGYVSVSAVCALGCVMNRIENGSTKVGCTIHDRVTKSCATERERGRPLTSREDGWASKTLAGWLAGWLGSSHLISLAHLDLVQRAGVLPSNLKHLAQLLCRAHQVFIALAHRIHGVLQFCPASLRVSAIITPSSAMGHRDRYHTGQSAHLQPFDVTFQLLVTFAQLVLVLFKFCDLPSNGSALDCTSIPPRHQQIGCLLQRGYAPSFSASHAYAPAS